MRSPIGRRVFLSSAAAAAGVVPALLAQRHVGAQVSGQIPGPPGEPAAGRARRLGLGEGARDGLLYVPRNFTPGQAMPLVVMLHGAGGTSLSTQFAFEYADVFGFIVLAPDSRDDGTWDALLGEWGPDVAFIGEAMRYTVRQCAIVRDRIGLAGFSDGASYALSMGIGAGDTFSRIMAMSPGVMQ